LYGKCQVLNIVSCVTRCRKFDLQQLPSSVQILHLAPAELRGPAMHRLARRPSCSSTLAALDPLLQ
jgi:hypothetical protein